MRFPYFSAGFLSQLMLLLQPGHFPTSHHDLISGFYKTECSFKHQNTQMLLGNKQERLQSCEGHLKVFRKELKTDDE